MPHLDAYASLCTCQQCAQHTAGMMCCCWQVELVARVVCHRELGGKWLKTLMHPDKYTLNFGNQAGHFAVGFCVLCLSEGSLT
jgi:hypothetical protein